MKNIYCTALALVLMCGAAPAYADTTSAASNGVQMLPPVSIQDGKTTCKGDQTGLLIWDGVHTINCVSGSTVDTSGDLTLSHNLTTDGNNTVYGHSFSPTLSIGTTAVGPSVLIQATGSSLPFSIRDTNSNTRTVFGGATFSLDLFSEDHPWTASEWRPYAQVAGGPGQNSWFNLTEGGVGIGTDLPLSHKLYVNGSTRTDRLSVGTEQDGPQLLIKATGQNLPFNIHDSYDNTRVVFGGATFSLDLFSADHPWTSTEWRPYAQIANGPGQNSWVNLTDGRFGVGTITPLGNLDIEDPTNPGVNGHASLCLNGHCVTNLTLGSGTTNIMLNFACSAGQALTGISNNQPVCSPINTSSGGTTTVTATCPDGQVLTGITNNQPNCATMPVSNPANGNLLYVKYASFTNHNDINAAALAGAALSDPSKGTVYNMIVNSCQLKNDNDPAFSSIASNISCQSAICYGVNGVPPNLVFVNGTCEPGQGNPACDSPSPQHMVLTMSCLDAP